MALPSAYLTSIKNLRGILDSIKNAQAPSKFTNSFLESLDYKSSSDRLIIGVLKALNFLAAAGEPTSRYFAFLDKSQSERILADGIREAYSDLFQINTKANEMSKDAIKNKLKTLTQGKVGEAVLNKMAMTFKALAALADFSAQNKSEGQQAENIVQLNNENETKNSPIEERASPLSLGGLIYNIQVQLPVSRDQAVYDALFRSLKEHLLK